MESWSFKKKKYKNIKAYRKSVLKEPKVKRCLFYNYIALAKHC